MLNEFEMFEGSLDGLRQITHEFRAQLMSDQDAKFIQTDEYQNYRQDMDFVDERFVNLKT